MHSVSHLVAFERGAERSDLRREQARNSGDLPEGVLQGLAFQGSSRRMDSQLNEQQCSEFFGAQGRFQRPQENADLPDEPFERSCPIWHWLPASFARLCATGCSQC